MATLEIFEWPSPFLARFQPSFLYNNTLTDSDQLLHYLSQICQTTSTMSGITEQGAQATHDLIDRAEQEERQVSTSTASQQHYRRGIHLAS